MEKEKYIAQKRMRYLFASYVSRNESRWFELAEVSIEGFCG